MGRRRRLTEDQRMTAITRLLKSYLQINMTPKYDRQTQALDRCVTRSTTLRFTPNRNATQGIEAATPQEGSGVDLQMKDTDYDPISGVSDDHLYYANQSGEDNSPELDNTVVTRVRENSIGLHGDGTAKYEEPRIGRSSATNYRNRMDCYQGRTET